MKSLIIVGGGMTGLSAAYLAAKSGIKVTLLESAAEVGGLLWTFEVGGTDLECFYHHAFTRDAEFLWLLRELGIEDRFEFCSGTMGVFRGGQAYAFNGPVDLLRFAPMSFGDKARFALSSLYLARMARWEDYENVPALEWFYKYAGRRATESLWEPLLRVKFGPYAETTPLAWMVGRMRQRVNSRKGGQEKLGYMRGSLRVVREAFLRSFAKMGVTVRTSVAVTGLNVEKGELKGLQTNAGEMNADAFLFTIPTNSLSQLVKPISHSFSEQLSKIEYFGAVCTVMELSRSLSPFYWLNVADPGMPFGGIIEHTNLVAPSVYGGRTIVYLSRYFAPTDDLARETSEGIQRIMLGGVKTIFPHFSEKDLLNVRVFSSRTAAVACDLNFAKKVPACRTFIGNMFLASMPHIYPDERSCNNSVRVAAEACRVMGLDGTEVPRCASLSGQINMR